MTCLSVNYCSWFVQTVHGRHFSRKRWEEFVRSRPIPGSPVAFAEIEVMLCNIPNRLDLMTEKMELEKEKEGIIIDITGGIMVNIHVFF